MRTLAFPYPSNPANFVVIVTLAHDVLGQKLYQRIAPNLQSFRFAKIQQLFLTLGTSALFYLRQRSHLMPGNDARVRYSLGANVNTPFFQVPTLKFG